MAREFDLILYGATGFTGKLAARFLADQAPRDLKWAAGGRDAARLQAVLEKEVYPRAPHWRGNVGVVVGHGDTAIEVARRAKAVISTAGPYQLYGEPLLAACIEAGTHYADLTGETTWVKKMLAKYGEKAREKGVKIVPCSGFDSVPADIGVHVMMASAGAAGKSISSITACMTGSGTISGGTIASMLETLKDKEALKMARDRYLLATTSGASDVAGRPAAAGLVPSSVVRLGSDFPVRPKKLEPLGVYTAPFIMAPVNTRIVARSAMLAAAGVGADAPASSSPFTPVRYPTSGFKYAEVMGVKTWLKAAITTLALGFGMMLLALPGVGVGLRRLGLLPSPGQGGSEAAMAKSRFAYTYVAETTEGGAPLIGRLSGGDGGYVETGKMLGAAGLLLATGAAAGGPVGFLTPSTAFGMKLAYTIHEVGERDRAAGRGPGLAITLSTRPGSAAKTDMQPLPVVLPPPAGFKAPLA